MQRWSRFVLAALVLAGAAPPVLAQETDDVPFTLELAGASPKGDALLIRERFHPEDGEACPANAYPRVKGRCSLGVTLHVCDLKEGFCDSTEVYARLAEGAVRTSEQQAAANLGEAKKKAAALGVVIDENARPLLDEVPNDLLAAEGLTGLSLAVVENGESIGVEARAGELALRVGHLGHEMQGPWEIATFLTPDRSAILVYAIREDFRDERSLTLVRVRPLAARLLELRAHARYGRKEWAAAARDYAAAVDRDPTLATAGVGLGLAQLRLGKRAEAQAALQRALAGDASPPPTELHTTLEPSIAAEP